MTTVLTLPGLAGSWDAIPPILRGEITAGNRVVPMIYNNWDFWWGPTDGKIRLDIALHTYAPTDNVIVLGHSLGAVVIGQWLRDFGPYSNIDPSRVKFIGVANSIHPRTGRARWLYGEMPATSRYTYIDVTRQYDTWADYPNVTTSPNYNDAVSNCNAGDAWPYNIHIGYNDISLSYPHWASTSGNITYTLFETGPLPLTAWGGTATRDQIESAYDRVVTSPV